MKRLLELARSLGRWLLGRWARLGTGWRVALVAVGSVALVAGSVAGYKGYNYVEHDNRFCTTCHLMDDAVSRFNLSAHKTIECHDCHYSSRVSQAWQLYATIFRRPTEVEKHAAVPNRYCEDCHVRGDSARWRIIAATAGHRIHLESRDSTLRGLQCVTCHTRSLHDFVSADSTCGLAGCHADTRIQLGKMASLEIYCATCHNFMAEAPRVAFDSLDRPLTPQTRQCLTCHEMRERLGEMEVADDPHRGTCGDCHNPHTQTTSRQIDCASAACHAGWRDVSFHRGVPRPEDCTSCHLPHSWKVEGQNCTRCHQGVLRERPTRRAAAAAAAPGSHEPAPPAAAASRSVNAHQRPPLAKEAAAPQQRSAARAFPEFSHGDHRAERCASCHDSRERHGALTVRANADCQRCHHAGPAREQCTTCHAQAELRRRTANAERTFPLTARAEPVTRRLRFDHERHAEVACAQCHSTPLTRAADNADCASCHAPHHRPAANCLACHAGANALGTHRVEAHGTCATAACHGQRAAALPVSRESCVVCHEAQINHRPGRTCETCHRVTAQAAS